ncbi:MAG: hypothetical protein QGH43_03030 [Arenicellales bacterium]|jgi:hypothetical protein|nr:hypothetical protein [Arenicellales bacterium]
MQQSAKMTRLLGSGQNVTGAGLRSSMKSRHAGEYNAGWKVRQKRLPRGFPGGNQSSEDPDARRTA